MEKTSMEKSRAQLAEEAYSRAQLAEEAYEKVVRERPETIRFGEFVQARDAMPLESARFLDLLPAEAEESWQELVVGFNALDHRSMANKQSVREHVSALWHDEAVPQVFKDRIALMYAKSISVELESFFSRDWHIDKKTTRQYMRVDILADELVEQEAYDSWRLDLLEYQQTHDIYIIGPQPHLSWAAELFDRGIISQELFESQLEKIDLPLAEPKLSRWNFDSDGCAERVDVEFPVLSSSIKSEIGHFRELETPLKNWAVEKFSLWLQHEVDPELELPDWLARHHNHWRAADLSTILFMEQSRSNAVDWQLFEKAVDVLGWCAVGEKSIFRAPWIRLEDSLNFALKYLSSTLLRNRYIVDAVGYMQQLRQKWEESGERIPKYYAHHEHEFALLEEVRDGLPALSAERRMITEEIKLGRQHIEDAPRRTAQLKVQREEVQAREAEMRQQEQDRQAEAAGKVAALLVGLRENG